MLQRKQFVQGALVSAALTVAAFAAGCGGNSTTNNAPIAIFEFGQPNYQNTTPNRGLGIVTSNTSLNSPGNAAIAVVSSASTLFYIADTKNNRILGFNGLPTSNSNNTATGANFVIGQAGFTTSGNGTSSGQAPATTALQLANPTKVMVSPDNTKLLVVDSANNRVLIWNSLPTSNIAPDIVLGTASATPTAASLSSPRGATFAPTAANPDQVIVADTGNNRVLVYKSPINGGSADYVLGQRGLGPTTLPTAGGGTANATGFSPNCPQLTSSITINCDSSNFQVGADTLANPGDVWSDGFTLLVADSGNGRVLYYSTLPTVTGAQANNVIGQSTMVASSTSGGGATGFTNPTSVWNDTNFIYVADKGNNRVLAFQTPSANGTAAVVVYGQGNFTHVTANDDDQNNVSDTDCCGHPQASDRTLFAPGGMVTVGSGTASLVYILDSGNSRLMAYNTF